MLYKGTCDPIYGMKKLLLQLWMVITLYFNDVGMITGLFVGHINHQSSPGKGPIQIFTVSKQADSLDLLLVKASIFRALFLFCDGKRLPVVNGMWGWSGP